MFLTEEAEELAKIGSGTVSKPPTYYKNAKGDWVLAGGAVPLTGQNHAVGYNNNTVYKSTICYHKNDFAFHSKNRGIKFYGATGFDATPRLFDIAFDLNGGQAITARERFSEFVLSGPDEYLALNEKYKRKLPPIIAVAWPDMGIPTGITREFWENLIALIPDNSHVLATCTGGHGRTGSFLTIALGILENLRGQDAIDLLRSMYCTKAIETTEQERYIKEILDAKV